MATMKEYDPEFTMQLTKEALETGNCMTVARRHDLHTSVMSSSLREQKTLGAAALGGSSERGSQAPGLHDQERYEQVEHANDKLEKLSWMKMTWELSSSTFDQKGLR